MGLQEIARLYSGKYQDAINIACTTADLLFSLDQTRKLTYHSYRWTVERDCLYTLTWECKHGGRIQIEDILLFVLFWQVFHIWKVTDIMVPIETI